MQDHFRLGQQGQLFSYKRLVKDGPVWRVTLLSGTTLLHINTALFDFRGTNSNTLDHILCNKMLNSNVMFLIGRSEFLNLSNSLVFCCEISAITIRCKYNTQQHNTPQSNAIQCNTIQCNVMKCNVLLWDAMLFSAMGCTSVLVQCTPIECYTMQFELLVSTRRNAWDEIASISKLGSWQNDFDY